VVITTSTTGTTGTTSSQSSTGTGAGGASTACTQLANSGAPITYDAIPSAHGSRPILVRATDDGSLAGVIFATQDVSSPSPIDIASAAFSPWGSWPATIGPVSHVVSSFGDPFAAAPAMAKAQPGFSILFFLQTASFPSAMYLATAAAGQSTFSYPQGTLWDISELARPVALARGAENHLAAYEVGMGGEVDLRVAVVEAAIDTLFIVDPVTCANAPFPADVTEAQGGYLIATAAGRKFGACLLDDGVPGPAKDLQVILLDQVTGQISLSASFGGVDPVAHVALARRAGGAWAVWQENGASAEFVPAIQAVRLDEAGAVAGPVFPVTNSGGTVSPFAAAAIGSNLAVAWVDTLDPSTPTITIRIDVVDAYGALVTSSSIDTAPSWPYEPSLSLLVSPDQTQMLLAWADQASPAPAVARVARLSCVGAL
jgi:hypothetical protein